MPLVSKFSTAALPQHLHLKLKKTLGFAEFKQIYDKIFPDYISTHSGKAIKGLSEFDFSQNVLTKH